MLEVILRVKFNYLGFYKYSEKVLFKVNLCLSLDETSVSSKARRFDSEYLLKIILVEESVTEIGFYFYRISALSTKNTTASIIYRRVQNDGERMLII